MSSNLSIRDMASAEAWLEMSEWNSAHGGDQGYQTPSPSPELVERKEADLLTGVLPLPAELLRAVAEAGSAAGSTAGNTNPAGTRISTGSTSFDHMLGGGIHTQSLTQVYGESRTGKTQLSHTLCVTCQLPSDMGGGGGKCAFIDTEGTFSPGRIVAIAERFGRDAGAALDDIAYARALNYEHQVELFNHFAGRFAEEPGAYRLLVIDSILTLPCADYSGRGECSECQQELDQMLGLLSEMSEEYNVAVVLTNQVHSDAGASAMFAGAGADAVDGPALGRSSATRICLRQRYGGEFVAALAAPPGQPTTEATYTVTPGGIQNIS